MLKRASTAVLLWLVLPLCLLVIPGFLILNVRARMAEETRKYGGFSKLHRVSLEVTKRIDELDTLVIQGRAAEALPGILALTKSGDENVRYEGYRSLAIAARESAVKERAFSALESATKDSSSRVRSSYPILLATSNAPDARERIIEIQKRATPEELVACKEALDWLDSRPKGAL